MELYDYQQKVIDEIESLFKDKRKILLQLPTGAGKTFVFSFFAKKWIKENNKKVLILCHRSELVEQTTQSLVSIGLSVETVYAKTKSLLHNSDIYVSMDITAFNRLSENDNYFKNIGLVIADECHELRYEKIFKYFLDSKILGVTATPCNAKRYTFFKCNHCSETDWMARVCHNEEMQEWTRPFTFSEIYEDIVTGIQISELIDKGTLVQDINFIRTPKNIDVLKTDSSGDFTNTSMNEVYANDEQSFNVLLNYEEICKGKKTIIFTSSTKVNKILLEKFSQYNVKSFDSVNDKGSDRHKIVDWFKNNSDAILINTGVFTTGFDVRDIQAVILNLPTQSLSKFLQMVGRGGRCTRGNEIYKDNFIVVDGGGNVERFGHWSDNKDWRNIFYKGLIKPKAKKESLELTKDCLNPKCGAMIPKSATECPECGFEVALKIKVKKDNEGEDVAIIVNKVSYPNAEKICNYARRCNEDMHFAWRVLINQVVDLFTIYQISKKQYLTNKLNGKLNDKIESIVYKPYSYIHGSGLQCETRRKRIYVINKIKTKLDEKYGTTINEQVQLNESN